LKSTDFYTSEPPSLVLELQNRNLLISNDFDYFKNHILFPQDDVEKSLKTRNKYENPTGENPKHHLGGARPD
jgi:hypothetical protein